MLEKLAKAGKILLGLAGVGCGAYTLVSGIKGNGKEEEIAAQPVVETTQTTAEVVGGEENNQQ